MIVPKYSKSEKDTLMDDFRKCTKQLREEKTFDDGPKKFVLEGNPFQRI